MELDSAALMGVYVVVALSIHLYVALKVTQIARLFQTDDGLQDFADRVMKAWIYSALTIPAHLFKILGELKAQAAEGAKRTAQEAVDAAAERVEVNVKK